eukprot:674760-Rhodomonas_salina.1
MRDVVGTQRSSRLIKTFSTAALLRALCSYKNRIGVQVCGRLRLWRLGEGAELLLCCVPTRAHFAREVEWLTGQAHLM